MNTDLIIVGGGAAGLMAGVTAGELGLRAVILERKHRPGLKLLMCGNNRCNLSSDLPTAKMLSGYGAPISDFLQPAVTNFSPETLQKWFQQRGLPTAVHPDKRVFPKSKNADHVLHFFTDGLRNCQIPLILNAPVNDFSPMKSGFRVRCQALELESRFLLLATGGVSYPKTGSVGDGHRFASQLGHKLIPYQAGLAGFELSDPWLTATPDVSLPDTVLSIQTKGGIAGQTCGEILSTSYGARGPAMVNASRIVAHQELQKYDFCVDLHPEMDAERLHNEIRQRIHKAGKLSLFKVIAPDLLPREIAAAFLAQVVGCDPAQSANMVNENLIRKIIISMKECPLHPKGTRPLKEAMVTVGGVTLKEVDSGSMESRIVPQLYFAGEVLDVDGPTGGYNLQAAFATARLAVHHIAARLGKASKQAQPFRSVRTERKRRPSRNRQRKRR